MAARENIVASVAARLARRLTVDVDVVALRRSIRFQIDRTAFRFTGAQTIETFRGLRGADEEKRRGDGGEEKGSDFFHDATRLTERPFRFYRANYLSQSNGLPFKRYRPRS